MTGAASAKYRSNLDSQKKQPGKHQKIAVLSICLTTSVMFGMRLTQAACPAPAIVHSALELNASIAEFNAATPPCDATITLANDLILFASTSTIDNVNANVSLTIEGAGKAIDTDRTGQRRVLDIAANTTVTLNEITLSGGRLSLTGRPAGFGAGIRSFGTLHINRSTVTDNITTDESGGGIAALGGELYIDESTISANKASVGGGIYANAQGGSVPVTLRNSTISGNDADSVTDGGGFAAWSGGSQIVLDSVTLTDNFPSGISLFSATSSTITIRNSILSDNVGTDDCVWYSSNGVSPPTLVDQGHNLLGFVQNCVGFQDGVNGTIVGQTADLLPLAHNGGPTRTHQPKLISPVIDAGDTDLPADQRGVSRPSGLADDIGAFDDPGCEAASWNVGNMLTEYIAAINCFNSRTSPGVYTITLTKPLVGGNNSPPAFNNPNPGVSLVLNGNSIEGIGNPNQFRAMEVAPNTHVLVNNMRLAEATWNGRGAGLFNAGVVTLNRSSIEQNFSKAEGGGIWNQGTLVLNESSVWGNQTLGLSGTAGGGIHNAGVMIIRNSTVSNNSSGTAGGGIANTGELHLDSVTMASNSAPTVGGLLLNTIYDVTLRNTILSGNTNGDCSTALAFTDLGYNLALTPGNCGFVHGMNNSIVGLDPLLGTLQQQLGGRVHYHSLLPGSPAIDNGSTSLTVDQRGLPRPGGVAKDIGAYEDQQLAKLKVIKFVPHSYSAVTLGNLITQDFSFEITSTQPGFQPISFLLDGYEFDSDLVPASAMFDLKPGAYHLKEIGVTGWTLTSIQCTTTVTANLPSGTATLTLQPYEDVTCTFTNDDTLFLDGFESP